MTGTVFSITIVTLQLASSSYTPRILSTFTSDRGAQTVLGTYMATFLYSLLVLRIIRTPESEGASFNPVISMTVVVLLALMCVALLIYFIAHIVNLIQSSTIVRTAHQDATKTVANLDDLEDAPAEDPRAPEDRPELAGLLAGEPYLVRARESGYVQYLNTDAVADAEADGDADEETAVVDLPFGPGEFVAAGLPVARIWPSRDCGRRMNSWAPSTLGRSAPFGKTSPSASGSSRTWRSRASRPGSTTRRRRCRPWTG